MIILLKIERIINVGMYFPAKLQIVTIQSVIRADPDEDCLLQYKIQFERIVEKFFSLFGANIHRP